MSRLIILEFASASAYYYALCPGVWQPRGSCVLGVEVEGQVTVLQIGLA